MRILLLMTMLFFVSAASAGLYKWIDEEGNVHYSQKRPLNKEYKRLKAPAAGPAESKPLYQSISPAAKSNNTAATETTKNLKIRAENCEKAKNNLNNFQIYRRIRDKDGNVTRIDDKEREKKIENAKQAISDFCD